MRAPDSGREITLWIDTCVCLEVDSHGDIFDEADKHLRGEAADVEIRRVRMQESLWMAMALCMKDVVTVHYLHETVNNLLRIAPPGSGRGAWTSAILYMLGDGGVFAGWHRCAEQDGAQLKNRARDRLMIETCRNEHLVLVTRDEEVIIEAHAEGVTAMRPGEYASTVLPREAARKMFMERIVVAGQRYVDAGPPEERERRTLGARNIIEVYERVWYPGEMVLRSAD